MTEPQTKPKLSEADFFHAIVADDFEDVEYYLEIDFFKANKSPITNDGYTPLMMACRTSPALAVSTARILLTTNKDKLSVDINAKNAEREGKTALMFVCNNDKLQKRKEMVQLFLSREELDLNLADNNDRTAFFYLFESLFRYVPAHGPGRPEEKGEGFTEKDQYDGFEIMQLMFNDKRFIPDKKSVDNLFIYISKSFAYVTDAQYKYANKFKLAALTFLALNMKKFIPLLILKLNPDTNYRRSLLSQGIEYSAMIKKCKYTLPATDYQRTVNEKTNSIIRFLEGNREAQLYKRVEELQVGASHRGKKTKKSKKQKKKKSKTHKQKK